MARTHWQAAPATIILLIGMLALAALAGLPARAALATRPACAVRAGSCAYRSAPVSAAATGNATGFDVVSATGGHVGGVAISANLAYFAEGAGLTILDISNTLLPVQIARLMLPAIAEDVQVAGNAAYVTTGKGLYVVDVSQPATPVLSGNYATPGDAIAVRLSGARAYITVGGVYDPVVSDYVGKGLQIIDISNPTHPTLLGSYQTSDFPGDIQVIGNLAYLMHGDGYNDGVQILNISDPAHITPQGNYAMPGKDGLALKVVGGKAYIGYVNSLAFNGGVQIVNVSTPAHPTLLGSYATTGPVWDLQITGNLAFLAAHTQLIALDIGTSSKPSLISMYNVSGIAEALYDGLQVVNGLAYLSTEAYTHEQIVGVQIVDIHAPAAPAARGAYRTLWSVGDTSNPNSFKLAGNVGYTFSTGQVRAFDITNPARPMFMGTSAPTTTYDLDIAGSRLYNAGGNNGLQIYDIGNPNSPTLIGKYVEPSISFERVRVSQGRAYLSADARLKVVDVSDPGNPVLLGQFYTGVQYPYSVEVIGRLAYIASDYGLAILDVGDPANITAYAGYHPDTATNAVEVVGTRAYLAARGYFESNVGVVKQGLYIADIGDPAHPQQLGHFATPGSALAVRVAGNRAYVAGLVGGLGQIWTVDISDAANPALLDTYDLPSQPGGMVIRGDLMYVAGGNAGLLVLRIHGSSAQSGQIAAGGGALAFGDTLGLTFPAGAVTAPVTVTYGLLPQPTHALPGDQRALHSFTLEARDGSGDLVTHFAKSYTLVISYTEAQLAAQGIAEADLNLAFWDGSAWANVLPCAGCGVDTVNNRLTVVLDHFTEFALAGNTATGDTKSKVYLPVVLR